MNPSPGNAGIPRRTRLARRLCLGLGLFLNCLDLSGAQAIRAIRLAIAPVTPDLAPAVDVLTVELSHQAGLELLERAQIDRVYREQGLAAGSKSMLQLGQVLGADGVLVLERAREGERMVLDLRLAAVKPGAILRQRRHPWPLENLTEWAAIVSAQFQPMLPKLAVLPKDALPISVLNLRSATRSLQAESLERELTLLVQNRLTQERELFVLERRRLGGLADEKELKPEPESPFWNGSYLLEGSIDRDGFSRDVTTVNARLVPPGGGLSTEIDVAGPRTNLVRLAEELSLKILESLRRTSSVSEWKAADEAARFLEEAKWALQWRQYGEAQAAADSAWALGRRDLACALVRVKSYTAVVPPDTGGYQRGQYHNDTRIAERTLAFVRELQARYPQRVATVQRGAVTLYTWIGKWPAPEALDRALHALSIYLEFAKSLPADEPKAGSPWSTLGIDALEASSQVLEHFHFVPESQPPVADKLAELRALAREAATWLERSPSVQATYGLEGRPALTGVLPRLNEVRNIFACQLDWGCFWQDRPEDAIALYRERMSSPAFASLNTRLWFRPIERPRLAAWNEDDRRRRPAVWDAYLQDLAGASNVILQLEGRFLKLADWVEAKDAAPLFDEMFALLFHHRDAIVSNAVDLLDQDWHLHELISNLDGSMTSPEEEQLARRFRSEHQPKLQAMREERAQLAARRAAELGQANKFERQRQFLIDRAPYNPINFVRTFPGFTWSTSQAAELLPLVASYRSNLVERSASGSPKEKSQNQLGLGQLQRLEDRLKAVAGPPSDAIAVGGARGVAVGAAPVPNAPPAARSPTTAVSRVIAPATGPTTAPAAPNPFVAVTNVLTVSRFVKLPVERLTNGQPPDVFVTGFFIHGHRWREGRLWLDCRFELNSSFRGHCGHHAVFMAWNPSDGRWEIFPTSNLDPIPQRAPVGFMGEPETRLHFEIFNGAIYLSDADELRRLDLRPGRRWEKLQFPGQQLTQLFAVNQRLFAANDESIYEVLNDGQSTRVLASCRRRPAASALDSLVSLGWPVVFPGPGDAVRATVGAAVFEWDGRDWREILALPSGRTQTFDDATLLRSLPSRGRAEVRMLPNTGVTSELCWSEEVKEFTPVSTFRPPARRVGEGATSSPSGTWGPLPGAYFAAAPATIGGIGIGESRPSLYFLVDHSDVATKPTGLTLGTKDGRHANLVCLDRRASVPLAVPLRFDLSQGSWTSWQLHLRTGARRIGMAAWLVAAPEQLIIGESGIPGVWVIPNEDIAAAVKSQGGVKPSE